MAKRKFLDFFPTIAVLLISACAFVPGIIASEFDKDIDQNTKHLADLHEAFDFFVDEARYVFEHDSNLYGLAWQEFEKAHILDIEFSILISNNLTTEAINSTYISKMLLHLNTASIIMQEAISFSVELAFRNEPELVYYEFSQAPNGYVYGFDRIWWNTAHVFNWSTLGDYLTVTYGNWYGNPGEAFFSNDIMDILNQNYSSALNQQYAFIIAEDTVFSLSQATPLYNLTQMPIFFMHDDIYRNTEELVMAEQGVANLQTIVSIMTVATLLATAISTRLAERKIRHQVSTIKADMKSDEDLVVREVDRFSVVILVVAVLAAIVGLVMVLLPF